MKDAWAELKHFPNWSEGRLMMGAFTVWLCAVRNQVLYKFVRNPVLHKFPNWVDSSWREKALQARAVVNNVRAIYPTIREEKGITYRTLAELDRVAAFFEQEAKPWNALLKIAAPSRRARASNALQIAFVNAMCRGLWQPTGRRPYTLVAILTNIALDVPPNQLWDADRVKHAIDPGLMGGVTLGNINPFFGQ